MHTFRIGEVAERSGFSASALRYYEGIGLVTPSGRTAAGYRIYDENAVVRLGFVARAKQLGCTLEEIADLVAIWDGTRCGPLQRRFHELVTDKIGDAHRQVEALTAFTAQLHTVAAQLAGEPVDGPCGEGCACLKDASHAKPVAVALGVRSDGPPISCTLDQAATRGRVSDWRAVLDDVDHRITGHDGSLRLEFDSGLDIIELARLVDAEQRCCAFFSFSITVDSRGIALEVSAPEDGTDMISALFDEPKLATAQPKPQRTTARHIQESAT